VQQQGLLLRVGGAEQACHWERLAQVDRPNLLELELEYLKLHPVLLMFQGQQMVSGKVKQNCCKLKIIFKAL
jgi:hypothetical protein